MKGAVDFTIATTSPDTSLGEGQCRSFTHSKMACMSFFRLGFLNLLILLIDNVLVMHWDRCRALQQGQAGVKGYFFVWPWSRLKGETFPVCKTYEIGECTLLFIEGKHYVPHLAAGRGQLRVCIIPQSSSPNSKCRYVCPLRSYQLVACWSRQKLVCGLIWICLDILFILNWV